MIKRNFQVIENNITISFEINKEDQIVAVHGFEGVNQLSSYHKLKIWQGIRNKMEREILKLTERNDFRHMSKFT